MEIIYKLPELFASALIGVLFTVLIPYVIKEMLMYKSAYSGYWVNVRDDKKNNIVKEDVFRMKHNPKTGFIKGKIVNIVTEKGKTQFVIGILKQDEIVYVVYSYDPIPSYSAVYVRLEESYVFSGFYLS
jgi:glutaredoxin-related protein